METETKQMGTPKLAEALAKAQAQIHPAPKDKTNPHFGSKYADLAAIIDACRLPLSENGLSFVQLLSNDQNGVMVVTRLMHISGEMVESPCWLPVAQKTPQGYGSAITYARRYGLATLVGVASEEDDDGNAASANSKPPPPPPPAGAQALKDKVVSKPNAPAANGSSVRAGHDRALVYPFGTCKGHQIGEVRPDGAYVVDEKSLIFWIGRLQTENNDASKSKWHTKNEQTIATLQAEQRYRSATASSPPRATPPPQLGDDGPPPLTDEDAPY
jgi:hypothetical protein